MRCSAVFESPQYQMNITFGPFHFRNSMKVVLDKQDEATYIRLVRELFRDGKQRGLWRDKAQFSIKLPEIIDQAWIEADDKNRHNQSSIQRPVIRPNRAKYSVYDQNLRQSGFEARRDNIGQRLQLYIDKINQADKEYEKAIQDAEDRIELGVRQGVEIGVRGISRRFKSHKAAYKEFNTAKDQARSFHSRASLLSQSTAKEQLKRNTKSKGFEQRNAKSVFSFPRESYIESFRQDLLRIQNSILSRKN